MDWNLQTAWQHLDKMQDCVNSKMSVYIPLQPGGETTQICLLLFFP